MISTNVTKFVLSHWQLILRTSFCGWRYKILNVTRGMRSDRCLWWDELKINILILHKILISK